MIGGYTGKSLIIDLKKQSSKTRKTNLTDAKLFIGAKGLGAKILIDELPPMTDPLSSENILMFTTGPLTGTKAQTSGRGTVITKSPLTGLYLDSHFGGIFAAEMKKAGWDFLIIKNSAQTPQYIGIDNEHIEFHDASKIWGKECLETHKFLVEKTGRVKTAVIGPAGEQCVNIAAITIDGHRHAGRGGAGAVMGSKNLKAIIIKGSQKIPLHDPPGFDQKAKDVLKKIQDNSFVPIRRKYGTPFWVKPVNDWGLLPTKNYQEGWFDQGEAINAESMQNRIVDGSGACYNCVIACWNRSSVKNGPFKGANLIGPEYETIALMGSNLGIGNIEDIAYLNERCNELGMDTISLGGILGFAIESFEKGTITLDDLNGKAIGWGKTKELAALVKDIAYRRGKIASFLADGVKKASEHLGDDTADHAIHVKGLEIPGYDPRGVFGMGLAYATSDRGACHQRAWTVRQEINSPDYDRFSMKKKAQLVKSTQDERAAFFSLVLCDFAPISENDCVDLWNLASGFEHTVDSYLLAGERIWNLIRVFNLREGLDPSTDTLPRRMFTEPFTKGPAKNIVINEKDFSQSLKEYYLLRGWTSKGIPKSEKLHELGLQNYWPMINTN
jgi:aldehyde:ferredoxin oxidoreductase